MLTAADVTAAIGAAVGAGAMKDSSQPLLETTQCNWPSATTPASRTAGFLIECSDRPDLHPVVTKESSQQFYRNVVAVSGFGDAAFWGWDWYVDKTVPPGSGALSILIGTNIQLIVGAEGMPDEATCRAASEQLARKALAKL